MRVIRRVKTNARGVFGITSVDDELFVLLCRDDNQVAVYNINDYEPLRHIHLPGFKPCLDSDMTSCARNKCLYISEARRSRIILRFDLTIKVTAMMELFTHRHISKWSVPGEPCGLSITPSRNLLVTCCKPTKLVELSAKSGRCLREITLQSDIESPCHAIQLSELTTDQFVVCHSDLCRWRVCLVDKVGSITRSYGGQPGSDVGQLGWPSHLAVDEDSLFIFVADGSNVVLLRQTLESVGNQYGTVVCTSTVLPLHNTSSICRSLFARLQPCCCETVHVDVVS